MITIYHNPRCSKSRSARDLVSNVTAKTDEPVEIIEYLKHPLSVEQLKTLHHLLACPLRDMIRSGEPEYQTLGLDNLTLDDEALYSALASHPILLQRPIVVRGERAVIGRPPENTLSLFS